MVMGEEKRREEKRREEKRREHHRWVGRGCCCGGRIRMPAARLANT